MISATSWLNTWVGVSLDSNVSVPFSPHIHDLKYNDLVVQVPFKIKYFSSSTSWLNTWVGVSLDSNVSVPFSPHIHDLKYNDLVVQVPFKIKYFSSSTSWSYACVCSVAFLTVTLIVTFISLASFRFAVITTSPSSKAMIILSLISMIPSLS